MQYRIEVSQTRKGFGQVHFPGRIFELEAAENLGQFWEVAVSDGGVSDNGDRPSSVSVRADSAGDAVWRVARAVVRAVSELTESPIDGAAAAAEANGALTKYALGD